MTTVRRGALRPAVALLTCVLAGCGTSSTPGADGAVLVDNEARATALGVLVALEASGVPVRGVVVCTPPAPAPPDQLRPRAAAFDDPRVATDDPRHVIREGGVVEVLDSDAAVRARVAELDQQALDAQTYGFDEGGRTLQPEHRLTQGPVLLRLSGDLPPAALDDYAVALRDAAPAAPDLSLLNDTQEAPCST